MTKSISPTKPPSVPTPTRSPVGLSVPKPKPKPVDGFGASKPAVATTPPRSGVKRTVPAADDKGLAATNAAAPRERKPAVAATEAAAKPKAETPVDPKLKELTTGLTNAKDDAGRQDAANKLAEWTRGNIVDKEKLSAYLARPDVSAEEKSKTLGQLALEINRSEMVLGRSHIGGDGQWEHKGENQGDFVDFYQGHAKNAKTDAWCTKFATHAYQRLGMDLDDATGGKTSPFMSGSRLQTWATKGTDVQGKRLVPQGDTVASDNTHSSMVTGGDFKGLTSAVDAAKPEDRLNAVNDFMTKHGAPRPGDVIVRDKNNNVAGASHTLMVDRYDPKTGTLYTIEGNADNRVQGFSYDLKDPKVAAQMGMMLRLGPEMFNAGKPTPGQPQVSAADLLGHARQINGHLIQTAGQQGWLHSTDPTATAAVLSSGGANPWHPDNKTGTR